MPTTLDYLSNKQASVIIRAMLKAAFPATKFSVRTERGVSAIRVGWTDGPTCKRVEAITSRFEAGYFDGMTDSYSYAKSSDRLIEWEGVTYIASTCYMSTNRTLSAKLANACIAKIAAYWGGVKDLPTAIDTEWGYKIADAYQNARDMVRPDLDPIRDSWSSSIRRAAEDATAFLRKPLALVR